jgi:hypothetical protein
MVTELTENKLVPIGTPNRPAANWKKTMRKQYTDEQIREAIRKHGSGQPSDVFCALQQRA